jgi:hypothetical protein
MLTAATAASATLAGLKIAKRRGLDPAKRPSFRTRGRYLRRSAALGALANFTLTYVLWILIGSFSVSSGSMTPERVALLALGPAVFFAPAGAAVGIVCGWVWYKLDSVRRANHAEHLEEAATPAAREPTTTAIPHFSTYGHALPADLGMPITQNTTGDSLWDDFYMAEARGT